MFVKILNILQKELDGAVNVEFFYTTRRRISPKKDVRNLDDSENLTGKWIGTIPDVDKWYDVEIDVENDLVWGQNVILLESGDALIKVGSKGDIILQGQIEASEDGFITIEIGQSLLALEIARIPKPFLGFVQIQATGIRLYDTGILG